MSLIDDARLRIANAVNSRWSRAEIVSEVLAALTADGPVILLPDEGEGVRAVLLTAAVDRLLAAARGVAE